MSEDQKRKAEDPGEEVAKRARSEAEKDDVSDPRPSLQSEIGFYGSETTLNVFSAMQNQVLMALTEGGMQHLLAGARANVGISSGRYFYEVRILETLNPAEAAQGRGPQPRMVCKLGFSSSSCPLLGETEDCAFFESDGMFTTGKSRNKRGLGFGRDSVVGILLNLDSGSPLANTMSLFRDGVRASDPQPLPDTLKGQALFPHVIFRHVTLQVNMGPTPLTPLPFQCRMLQAAAKADVEETADPSLAGKFEVLVPVGIPDEGTFDWLDVYLQDHPSYVELSDRKIMDWASRSGLAKPRAGANSSNDKPSFSYNLPSMDDGSIQRVIKSIAPTVPRNYVVMEVKSNLVREDRMETLKRFNTPNFKKVALVVMGEPGGEFLQKSQAALLLEKQSKLDSEWRARKAAAQRQKEMQEMRRKADEQRKRRFERKEEEELKEEMNEEEVKMEDVKEDEPLGEPLRAELTEEEKRMWRPKALSDLAPMTLSKYLHHFTLPDKSEGFDEVNYVWLKSSESADYLRKWILEAKRTTLIEHIQPSQEFTNKFMSWQKQQLEWQQKQSLWKAKAREVSVNVNLDIFAVEDVNDICDGEPLYGHFEPADWALLQLRYELYLLQDAFKKDVNDPDRSLIPEPHLSFYYNRYFRKQLSPGAFNLKNNTELLAIIKDVVTLTGEPPVLTSQLDALVEAPDIFVKLTEESRRERKRRAEAGDETSQLKYTVPAVTPPPPRAWPPPVRPRPQWQQFGGGGWNRW